MKKALFQLMGFIILFKFSPAYAGAQVSFMGLIGPVCIETDQDNIRRKTCIRKANEMFDFHHTREGFLRVAARMCRSVHFYAPTCECFQSVIDDFIFDGELKAILLNEIEERGMLGTDVQGGRKIKTCAAVTWERASEKVNAVQTAFSSTEDMATNLNVELPVIVDDRPDSIEDQIQILKKIYSDFE